VQGLQKTGASLGKKRPYSGFPGGTRRIGRSFGDWGKKSIKGLRKLEGGKGFFPFMKGRDEKALGVYTVSIFLGWVGGAGC